MYYRTAVSFYSAHVVRRVAPRATTSSLTPSLSRRVFSSVEVPDPPTSHHVHHPLSNAQGTILYTETDEAPALATFCLYPILRKVRQVVGVARSDAFK